MRYFSQVCKHGNITKAAESLDIAQPSVTTSIQKMEKTLGISLFHRINQKLVLTEEGTVVLEEVSQLLTQYDTMMEKLTALSTQKRCIKIGLPLHVGSYLMPIILGGFHDLYPDIELELVELGGLDTITDLEAEQLDIAIVARGGHFPKTLDHEELFTSECCFCTNKNHPLAHCEMVTLEQIHKEPVVLLQGRFYIGGLITRYFQRHGYKVNTLVKTSQLNTVKNLLNCNIASAFLMRETVLYDENIVDIPFDPPILIDICLAWKKNRYLSPEVTLLAEYLKKKRYA